jgi:hypothetical protein
MLASIAAALMLPAFGILYWRSSRYDVVTRPISTADSCAETDGPSFATAMALMAFTVGIAMMAGMAVLGSIINLLE